MRIPAKQIGRVLLRLAEAVPTIVAAIRSLKKPKPEPNEPGE